MKRTEAYPIVREQKHFSPLETILLSTHHTFDPKVLAQTVLSAINQCFSPVLSELYQTSPEQNSFSLLARYPPNGRSTIDHPLPLLKKRFSHEALRQNYPLITKITPGTNQNEHKAGNNGRASLLEAKWLVALPLLCEGQCEGLLVIACADIQEAEDPQLSTLLACTSHLAHALKSTRLHTSLANEQYRLQAILDQLPEGVVVVESAAGTVKYANPAAATLLGVSLQHLLGNTLKQTRFNSPSQSLPQHYSSAVHWDFPLVHALSGQKLINQELFIIRPDGSEITVLGSAAPLYTAKKHLYGAVLAFQDQTSLKQLERQKNEFFAIANHELRTPLTVIMGFAEILQLQTNNEADPFYQFAISSINNESEHLLHLIQEMLDTSRLGQARLQVERAYQDLLPSLIEIVHKYIHTTKTHHLLLISDDKQPQQLFGWFDLSRIEQIIKNLITNAIKYSPAGSTIEVAIRLHRNVSNTAQEALIMVKDQGIGITEEEIPHVFERFYRVKTKTSSAISGFGIGLYVTKALVQAHGGRIWVESQPDRGSTFLVVLPLGTNLPPTQ